MVFCLVALGLTWLRSSRAEWATTRNHPPNRWFYHSVRQDKAHTRINKKAHYMGFRAAAHTLGFTPLAPHYPYITLIAKVEVGAHGRNKEISEI